MVLVMMILWIWMIVWTFFGWSWDSLDEENIMQYDTTWIVEEIVDKWNIMNSWNIQVDNVDVDIKWYTEIKVMMPRYFYNTEWKRFAQDLFDDKKVYMNFILIDDLNQYRDQLYSSSFSDADLFLFPYDWNEKVSTRSFSAQQEIQPYFDQLLSSITKGSQVKFLPFAADPMVMYAYSWYLWPNNFYEISEYVLNREPIRSLSFPLFFGLTSEDLDNNWYVREYQDIVWYALMHYFRTNSDSSDLQRRIDSNILEKYKISDMKTISKIITTPECKYFPSICFQIFNFVWIRFGFLSDADVVNQYLHNKKSDFSTIQKLTMPFFQLESPIRIWWWWMPTSLEKPEIVNWVYAFLIQYMNNYDKYDLRNSTLSVFKTNVWNGLLDNEYIWLRWYILSEGWDYIYSLRWMDGFKDLLEYKITANEYLR